MTRKGDLKSADGAFRRLIGVLAKTIGFRRLTKA